MTSPTLSPSTRYEDIFDHHTAPFSSENDRSSSSTAESQWAQYYREQEEERLRMRNEGPARKKKRDVGRGGEEEDAAMAGAMVKVKIIDEQERMDRGVDGKMLKDIGCGEIPLGDGVEVVGEGMEL